MIKLELHNTIILIITIKSTIFNHTYIISITGTDDPNIRKQMLRQKLLIGDNVAISAQGDIVVAHVDNSGVAVRLCQYVNM